MELIHLHIPKSAGSTFNYIMKRIYQDQVYEEKSVFNHVVELDATKIDSRYKAVFGHFDSSFINNDHEEVVIVSFLRDPIDRILSGYYNILRDSRNPIHKEVTKMSLLDYVESGILKDIDNGQVRRIAGIYDEVEYGKVDEKHYLKAIEIISAKNYFVGISELFDESLILLRNKMNWKNPYYHYIHRGKNKPKKLRIDESVLLKIINQNRYDYLLYLYSFRRIMNSIDDSVEYGVRSFRLKNNVYNALISPSLAFKKIKSQRAQMLH